MVMRFFILIAILLCTTISSFSADKATQDANRPVANPDQPSVTNAKRLKTDLERMRALLGQMQRNVAFVSPGDTPLKHQLQLEIEMWQILVTDMEKKSNETSAQ